MNILITGWYGTETQGDKAILSGILSLLKKNIDNVTIYIHSTNIFYTEQTLKEIGHEDSVIVSSKYLSNKNNFSKFSYVFFGGGPVMDVINITEIYKFFKYTKKNNNKFILFGVGYGPFRRRLTKFFANMIIKGSDFIITRDSQTHSIVQKLNSKSLTIGDPASLHFVIGNKGFINSIENFSDLRKDIVRPDGRKVRFVKINTRLKSKELPQENRKVISISLRELPKAYSKLKIKDHNKLLEKFTNEIIDLTIKLLNNDYEVNFIAMNTFYVGDDDRDYIAKFKEKIKHPNVNFNLKTNTLAEIIEEFKKSHIFIGMRYHSVLFSTSLGIPTIGIDYTQGGGKVSSYLRDLKYDQSISYFKLDADNLWNKVISIEKKYTENQNTLNSNIEKINSNMVEKYQKFIVDQIR